MTKTDINVITTSEKWRGNEISQIEIDSYFDDKNVTISFDTRKMGENADPDYHFIVVPGKELLRALLAANAATEGFKEVD